MAKQTSASKSSAKGKASKLATIKALLTGKKKSAPAPKAAAKVVAKKDSKADAKAPVKATDAKAGKNGKNGKAAPTAAELKLTKGAKGVDAATAKKGQVPTPPAKPGKGAKGEKQPVISKAAAAAAIKQAAEAESNCREVACEGLATSGGYCRLHYIKNWKKIKRKELILKEGKLNQYIEELVSKYPDKYIEAIRQDLAADKDFAKVIYDLELDEGVDDFEGEGEAQDAVIDSIKRDFDDEGETGF